MTDFNPTNKPDDNSFVPPSAIPEQYQLRSAFTPGIPASGGMRMPRLVHDGDEYLEVAKAFGFIALEGIDLYLQIDRDLKERETGRPVLESVITDVPIIKVIPVVGINSNLLRPDIEESDEAPAFASFVELAGGGINSGRRLWEDFSQREEPRVLAQNDDDFNIVLFNELLIPMHDFNSTYVAGGNPYIYDKSVDQPFHLTMSLLYGALFASRAVVLPLEAQRTRTSYNAGLGCTEERAPEFVSDGYRQSLGITCDEFQEENPNALPWLTNSNDDPEEVQDQLSTPSLTALETTSRSVRRYGNAYRHGEQIFATALAIESVQPQDGFGDTPIGLGTIVVALGIPAAQILIPQEAGTPLDGESIAWVLGGAALALVQSLTTDDVDIMLAYGDQDLLLPLGATLPGNYTAQYDANASGQSSLSKTALVGEILGSSFLYGLGGMSFGASLARDDLTAWERRGLWGSMVLSQGFNVYNTAKFVEEGETRILRGFASESAAFAGEATFSYLFPNSPVTKFLTHLDVGTYADGPYVAVNGKW